jgi:hypothetical protein
MRYLSAFVVSMLVASSVYGCAAPPLEEASETAAAATASLAGTYEGAEANVGFESLTLSARGDAYDFRAAVYTGIWCGPLYRGELEGKATVKEGRLVLDGRVVGPTELLSEPTALEAAEGFLGEHEMSRVGTSLVLSGYELVRR